jgi:hypothetical protein
VINPDTLLANAREAINRKAIAIACLEFETLDRQLSRGGPLPSDWAKSIEGKQQ